MGEYRMYLVMRDDLSDVPLGKLLGQAGHAFAHALYRAPASRSAAYDGEPEHIKIVTKASPREVSEFAERCRERGLPHHVQTDLARTHFALPTTTCVAIGPVTTEEAARLGLRSLRLF